MHTLPDVEHRRLVEENQRLVWELHVISEITASVTSSLNLDVVLQRALRRVMKTFSGDAALIRLKESSRDQFELRAHAGLSAAEIEGIRVAGAGRLPSDHVIATLEPMIVGDLHADDWIKVAHVVLDRLRSAICVPIFVAADLAGTLEIFSETPGRFTPDEQRVLLTVGRQLGVAVENARLYARVQQAKQEWERTVDAIGDAIAVFDVHGRLVRGNAALAQLLGCPVTELLGRTCRDVGFCGHDGDCVVEHAWRTRTVSRAHVVRPGGEVLAVVTLSMYGSDNAAVVQVAKNVSEDLRTARQMQLMRDELTATNVSLQKTVERLRAAQAQLIQSEKLSAMGQLVAGVAHELNNPLTSVIGYAQLVHDELLRRAEGPGDGDVRIRPEIVQDMQRIAEEADRAARIVRNLLAFARRQTGERSLQDIGDLIARVVSLRAYDLHVNNIEMAVDVSPDLPLVFADGNQIQQVLLNIVLNAEQAMSEAAARGTLRLSARLVPASDAIRIEIADSGPGIDPAVLPFIFDPFFTTKAPGKGTGLGLSICYGIVRDHGGALWAESGRSGGATFVIELPARVRATAGDSVPTKVLVAHGDAGQREFLCAALSAWGFDVAVAATAQEAVSRLMSTVADVAVVDPRVCGQEVEAWEEAFGRQPHLPLIITAAESDSSGVVRLAGRRPRTYIVPPFQLADLAGALRSITSQGV